MNINKDEADRTIEESRRALSALATLLPLERKLFIPIHRAVDAYEKLFRDVWYRPEEATMNREEGRVRGAWAVLTGGAAAVRGRR